MNAVASLLVIGFCIFLPIAFVTEASTCCSNPNPNRDPNRDPNPNPKP
jgi:hypothetical protein